MNENENQQKELSLSESRKRVPLHTFTTEYFPLANLAAAHLSYQGDKKHNPDNKGKMRWAREKSGDHLEAAMRHLMEPERIDIETGLPEIVSAFWRLGAATQIMLEQMGWDWETQKFKA